MYYLPFAAQPAIHNPVEEYERKDKFCFAGSFYVKYKERSKVFLEFAPLFMEYGLDIYDRNYKKEEMDNNSQSTSVASPAAENYYFPEELKECILGGLPYREISRAYKGYRYGVNMTSMVQSGFMFARRAFELLACNTVTVSNYSRGLELFFGDLLIATNDRQMLKKQLEFFCKTEMGYRKYRLAGLRHVLSCHLYEDRLDRIAKKVFGKSMMRPLPQILVVCKEENEYVRSLFKAQTYENKQLVMGSPDMALNAFSFDYITIFSKKDYYGRNYLMDMALSTRFASDKVIGKAAYYTDGELVYKEKAYTRVFEQIMLTRQMASRALFAEQVKIEDLYSFHIQETILSLDEFNYCENATVCDAVDDIDVYTGVPLDEIYHYTEHIPAVTLHKDMPFPIEELYEQVCIEEKDWVAKSCHDGMLCLKREADDDKIVWLRTDKNYEISQFTAGSRIGFFSQVFEKSGNVRCQIEYYDENNEKLDFLNFALDGFSLLRISDRAKSFKLIFRLRGKASVMLKSIYASSPDSLLPAPFPVRGSLLITDVYPDYGNPDKAKERHFFAKEKNAEVLLAGEMPSYIPYSEYDGVPVTSVQYSAVREYLAVKIFEHIYVDADVQKLQKELTGYQYSEIDLSNSV